MAIYGIKQGIKNTCIWFYLVIALFITVTQSHAMLTPPALQQLSWLEWNLFNTRYEAEAPANRLNRLEDTLFGSHQGNQPDETRLQHILSVYHPDYPPANSSTKTAENTIAQPEAYQLHSILEGKQSGKKQQTQKEAQQRASKLPQFEALPEKRSSSNNRHPSNKPNTTNTKLQEDYPVVSTMEYRVFNQAYKADPLETRVERLEARVLGNIQSGVIVDRVDQLRGRVLGDMPPPQVLTSQPDTLQQPNNPNDPYNLGYPSGTSAAPTPAGSFGDQQDLIRALTQTELQVLNATYPNESPDSRLTRLEIKVFQSKAPPGVSDEARLQRIVSVAAAGGSNGTESAKVRASGTVRGVLPLLLMLIPMFL